MKAQSPYLRWSLLFIGIGLAVRLITLDLPILEGAYIRQIQTAAIARNLLDSGFDVLHPQIDILPEPRYFVLEPPLYNTAVAFLYLIFGVHEYLGRLVSILAFCGTAWFIFRIAARNLNESVGRAAVFVFSFSPLSIIFTRAFQPDPAALFFSAALIYYFLEWVKGDAAAFKRACAFGILAFLTKQTFLFLLLPLSLCALYFKKKEIFKDARSYLFLFLCMAPPVAWSIHARHAHQIFPSPIVKGNFEFSNWFSLAPYFQYASYKTIFQWLSGLILTPFGFSLFVLGLFVRSEKDGDWILNFWLFGLFVFFAMFPIHATSHEYYYLPLLPAASIVIGKAWWFVFEKDGGERLKGLFAGPLKILGALILGVSVYGFSNSGFNLPASVSHFRDELEILNKNTRDGDLLIVKASYQLYYANNRGWLFPAQPYGMGPQSVAKELDYWAKGERLEPTPVYLLESYRKAGAHYYFVSEVEEFNRHKEFADYVFARYNVVAQKEGVCILFDLKHGPRG